MSNHLAVATVTAALGQVVQASAESAAVGSVGLRFGRPAAQAGSTERRVQVYLYQVTPHAALRNDDLPSRNAEGRLTLRPQAALELHYLLSFYGDDQKLEPDRMLGAVARDLHARPLLTVQDIKNAIASYSPELDGSDLDVAVERVKFTPTTLSLDEQSKLWSVLVQTPHALSLVYTASVVLIEALERETPALPVLRRGPEDRGVGAVVGPFPRLEEAWVGILEAAERRPRRPSLRAALLGSHIIINGSNLGGDTVTLRFKHPLLPAQIIDVASADRDGDQLRLTLPEDIAAQSAWAAGLYSVVASVTRGATSSETPAWPLLLAPRISAIAPNPAARVNGAVTLSIACRPRVLPDQSVTLLLADREVAAEPHAVVTDTLDFVIDPAPAVTAQLVWLRVDGAESPPLRIDPVSGNFVFDDAHRVTIT